MTTTTCTMTTICTACGKTILNGNAIKIIKVDGEPLAYHPKCKPAEGRVISYDDDPDEL